MRYAIVSDIHANFPAWEAVLADFRECNIEEVVCLGDVVGYGPKPAEVLEAVRAVTGNFVMGNHDAAAVGMMDYSIFNDHAREAIEWTMGQLDEAGKEFLSSVPLAIEAGDVLFVHAEIEEPGRFGYISDLEVAQRNLEAGKHFVTFIGHTHLPKVFEMDIFGEVTELTDGDITLDSDSRYIVNVGSVGEPRNPEDLRGRYVIYDTETQELEFRRVEFDIPAYRRDLEATTLSMRPFFLRTYEFTVEGQEVVVSQGGSLMDMRVGLGSVSLISSGQVARMGQLTGTHPVLASAKPSKAPKIILALFVVVAIGMVIALQMVGRDGAPVVKKEKEVEKKDPVKRREERSVANGGASGNGMPSPVISKAEANTIEDTSVGSAKAKTPKPKEKNVAPKAAERSKPESPPSNPKEEESFVRAWWRMDGASANSRLVDVGKKFPLDVVNRGEKWKPLAPNPIPLNKEENTSSLKIGIWQEAKPSGQFGLNSKKSFTFEGWFLAGKFDGAAFLVGTLPKAGDGSGWVIYLKPDSSGKNQGQIGFFYDPGQKGSEQKYGALAVKSPVAVGKEYHFAAVWDHDQRDDAGQMRLFLDGVQVADLVLRHADLSLKRSNPLSVGAEGNHPSLALDELRYSQRALAPHEFLLRPSVAGLRMIKTEKNNRDSWMTEENWEGGEVPEGKQTVIIGAGITAHAGNKTPPKFTGSLVLENNAKVYLWGEKGSSVIPKKPAKLEMYQNSRLIIDSRYNTKFGPVELHAQAEIWGGVSSSSHRMNRQFPEPITGPGKLVINGVNKNTIIFEARNTFTGGFEAFSSKKEPFRVLVKGKGSLGKGDVIIGDYCSLVLEKGTGGVIENKIFRLKGAKGNETHKLMLYEKETVGAFFIDGEDQGNGKFDSTTHKEIGGDSYLEVRK